MFSSILPAIPDFSKIVPIKMNKGTASKVTLFIIPKILNGMLLKISGSNMPAGMQSKEKSIDTPARVSATGYPKTNAAQTKTNNNRGIISI